MSYVQRGIFRGLGQSGEESAIGILVSYLSNSHNTVYLRLGAAVGLLQVGNHVHLYSEAARQRAVNALCEAVQHDTWEPTRAACARALAAFGDKRALSALERATKVELDDGVK